MSVPGPGPVAILLGCVCIPAVCWACSPLCSGDSNRCTSPSATCTQLQSSAAPGHATLPMLLCALSAGPLPYGLCDMTMVCVTSQPLLVIITPYLAPPARQLRQGSAPPQALSQHCACGQVLDLPSIRASGCVLPTTGPSLTQHHLCCSTLLASENQQKVAGAQRWHTRMLMWHAVPAHGQG